MAEVLIVVGIVLVLAGIVFIAVFNYQRSMAQLERDGIAKEIFIAAQNHLTAAQGQGYLGKNAKGTLGTYGDDAVKGIYYIVVTNGVVSEDGEEAFELLLPFASIDETVRLGGSYIIRYQPDAGIVLDVFYCSVGSSRFDCSLGTDDYATVMGLTGADKKSARRTFSAKNNSVLGWYGGAEAESLPTINLLAPSIIVTNDDTLSVKVTDPNTEYHTLKLIITGVLSNAKKSIELLADGETVQPEYTRILDDITGDNPHFCNISSETVDQFIPGENIRIQAVAYSTVSLSNIAYSAEKITNSLFADGSTETEAKISSFRHLENLDKAVSKLDENDDNKLNIEKATQTKNLDWEGWSSKYIYDTDDAVSNKLTTAAGNYYPVNTDYKLEYDGGGYSISNVKTETTRANSGLFGTTNSNSSVYDLELIDFKVKGTENAGALAGRLDNTDVVNVIARNSKSSSDIDIEAANAGGLAGTVTGGTIKYSGSTMIVSGTTTAGGLVGTAADGTEISGCFSGGHTKDGSYDEWVGLTDHHCDVTGATAGGLVGASANTTISKSYSTCSGESTAADKYAGGFAGDAGDAGVAGGSITNCYSTGLVKGTNKFAFVGNGAAMISISGCYYYSAINEVQKAGGKPDETEPMLPVSGFVMNAENLAKIKPIDLNAATYNDFSGAWDDWAVASAYDSALVKYYSGKYTLKTVKELSEAPSPVGYPEWSDLFVSNHYGDWPSPEVFFINTNS